MKIHAICVVKNEADIIEHALLAATVWADHIHVFDTGSTDTTWERVQSLAKHLPAIQPWKKEVRAFDDALRCEVFRAHRHLAASGDWWCRLDADEIFAENPREFLARVPSRHHVVWAAHAQFYFTSEDLARFAPDNPNVPDINECNRPRRYLGNASEARFFRHRAKLDWTTGSWPHHLGVVHPRRIPVRHFQFRSPQQIQLRLDTRRLAAAQTNYTTFGHSVHTDWRQVIRPAADFLHDDGKAPLIFDSANLPRHLETTPRRIIKLICHGLGIWP